MFGIKVPLIYQESQQIQVGSSDLLLVAYKVKWCREGGAGGGEDSYYSSDMELIRSSIECVGNIWAKKSLFSNQLIW